MKARHAPLKSRVGKFHEYFSDKILYHPVPLLKKLVHQIYILS